MNEPTNIPLPVYHHLYHLDTTTLYNRKTDIVKSFKNMPYPSQQTSPNPDQKSHTPMLLRPVSTILI